MKRLRGSAPVLLLAAAATLVGFTVLEGGARVLALREQARQGRLDRDLARAAPPRQSSVVTLGQIIKRSSNPRVVYELKPRLDVVFAGAHLTTSDIGHRGVDVRATKGEGVFRIVGIGDSYMFGQGVADDETYMALIPSLTPDLAVETVNLAVPGYNTVMEVALLGDRIDSLKPDLVLIEIVGNDLDLPNFLWNEVDAWTPRRSFLLDFIRGRLRRAAVAEEAGPGMVTSPHEGAESSVTFSRDMSEVPERYRSMVGLTAFGNALDSFVRLGRDRQIPVMAVTHGVWFEDDLKRALTARGIPLLILRSALRQRARSMGATDYARSPLALSPTDLHPSTQGHRVVAEEISRWILAEVPGLKDKVGTTQRSAHEK